MDSLLAAPAVVIVVIAAFQVRRARAERRHRTVLDLTATPAPRVDLEYLRARPPEHDREVLAPIAGETSLGARLLAADRSGADRRAQVVVHRRRRGEPLTAPR